MQKHTGNLRIRDAILHRDYSFIRRYWFAFVLLPVTSVVSLMIGAIGGAEREVETNLEYWLGLASKWITPSSGTVIAFVIVCVGLIDTMRSFRLVSSSIVDKLESEISQLNDKIRHLVEIVEQKDQVIVNQTEIARMDITTRIPNEVALHYEKESQIKAGVVLVMIDLVDFKRFNDDYGHTLGNEVLKSIAQFLFFGSRRTEKVYRLDHPKQSLQIPNGGSAYRMHRAGDEFLLILDGGEEVGIAFLQYRLKRFLSGKKSTVTALAGREIKFYAGVFAVETELTPNECLLYVDRCLSEARQKPVHRRLRWHSGSEWQTLSHKEGELEPNFTRRKEIYKVVESDDYWNSG